ncbi:AAWKG family protein [Streptomyces sp. A30]|uniref:AAWKG family protein n=1 Tax=Streptomyces sp. A30 TaxID=2789273 RepID=UPI0039812398
MADPKDNNSDNWSVAVGMLTGYKLPPREKLFDNLKGNDDIPMIHVRLDHVGDYYMSGFVSSGGWHTKNTDYTIPFYAASEDDGEVSSGARVAQYRAHITFLASHTELPPSGDDIISGYSKTSDKLKDKGGWNKEGEKLDWNTNDLVGYIYGAKAALDQLLLWPHSTHGFSNRGIDVTDGGYVDLLSFTEVAKSFDRAVKFFEDSALTVGKWDTENIGEGSTSWDGTSAAIFKELIHKLARNYEGYADQIKGKGGEGSAVTLDGTTVTSAPARALADVQNLLHTQTQNLAQAWNAWKPESNPQRWLYDMLQEARLNLFDTQFDKVDIASTYYYPGPATLHLEAMPGFSNDITIAGKSYGSPLEMTTWKAIAEEAVRKWEQSIQNFLGVAGSDAIVAISNAFALADDAFDEKVTDKDKRTLSEIAAGEELDKEKIDNKKALDEAKALADKEKAEAKALADKEKAEAKAERDEAKALADKEKAEAKALADKEKAEAKALADKEKAEAKAERDEAKALADKEKAEAKAEQAAAKAEAEKEKAEAKAEADKEKAEAKAEQAAAKEEAEKEKAEAKAQNEQDRADAKQAQEEAKQQAAQQQAFALAQADQQRAEAKKEKEEAKKEADAEKAAAKQEQEAAKALADKEKAEAKAEQAAAKEEAEKEKEQAKAEADKEKAEAKAEQAAAKEEAEKEKAEAKAQNEQDRAEAKKEKEEAKAEATAEKAAAKQEQEAAKAEAEREQEAAKTEAAEEKAAAKAEQNDAKAEAERRQEEARQEAVREKQQARLEAEQAKSEAQSDYEQQKADARAERAAAEQEADRRETAARQEYEQEKAAAQQERDQAQQQAEQERAQAQQEYDREIAGGTDEQTAREEYDRRVAEIDAAERDAVQQANNAEAQAKEEFDEQKAAAQEERDQARADAEQARKDAKSDYDQRMGDIQAEYDRINADDKDIDELIRQRVADLPQPPDISSLGPSGGSGSAGSAYSSAFSDNLYNEDDLASALGRPQGDGALATSSDGSTGGPGTPMMPPMMRGAGGDTGGPGERVRTVIEPGTGRSGRAVNAAPTVEDEEHRVVPRPSTQTSSNTPFMPPMAGIPGAGGPGQQTESSDRERTTWLAEDEDVWGTDEGGAPQALGR